MQTWLSWNPQAVQAIRVGGIDVRLVWFDSMGAKASSFLIQTPDIRLLVDPGTAEMQGSYPLPEPDKKSLRQKALQAIIGAAEEADTVFISHYHYDHHTLPEEASELYRGKRLWIKDPNRWICRSQWQRARKFLGQLCQRFEGRSLESISQQPGKIDGGDPLNGLPLALSRDYGDYQQRREELLGKGRANFEQLVQFWQTNPWVKETAIGGSEVLFVDGREFREGETRIRFTRPLFHGLEYTALGWVVGLVVECGGARLLYTSDLQGPTVEDYAEWVIGENPSLIIADGPPTYMLGYMVNRINLERSVENMCRILRQTPARVVVYDHHLLREPRFRERTGKAWEVADREGKRLVTAAELLGQEPLVLKLGRGAQAK